MKIYEVYIVKKETDTYEVKNIQGRGFRLNTPSPLDDEVSLQVYVNDYLLKHNIDYAIDGYTLKFANQLYEGDKITIVDSILNNVKLVSKSSYDKNAFQKLFSSYQKFKFNHRYLFNLIIKDEKYTIDFNTKYNPFYTTVDKIRLDTGTLLENVIDERIAHAIYLNSKDTFELLGGENFDAQSKIPAYAKNYVRYKTDIDLCYAIYLSISGKIGSFSKKIGDIQIDQSIKLPYLEDLLSRFKELLKPNEDLLNGALAVASPFVKAQKMTYPVSNRGVF